jgi:tRNA (guanine-N1)-methyltransferase
LANDPLSEAPHRCCRIVGSGPPVLLLHPSPQSGAFSLPMARRLAPDFTAIALDTPGYGLSDPLPGAPLSPALAHELSGQKHLILLSGHYEGIDQRVFDHFSTRMHVRAVSLGDYVLNGGEVAALAMIEAVARLVPGVVGNPESLVEESHEDGLLEYPSYTKPQEWRGLEVPPVLLTGNHGAIAAWRREQQVSRTRDVRPDLLPD